MSFVLVGTSICGRFRPNPRIKLQFVTLAREDWGTMPATVAAAFLVLYMGKPPKHWVLDCDQEAFQFFPTITQQLGCHPLFYLERSPLHTRLDLCSTNHCPGLTAHKLESAAKIFRQTHVQAQATHYQAICFPGCCKAILNPSLGLPNNFVRSAVAFQLGLANHTPG